MSLVLICICRAVRKRCLPKGFSFLHARKFKQSSMTVWRCAGGTNIWLSLCSADRPGTVSSKPAYVPPKAPEPSPSPPIVSVPPSAAITGSVQQFHRPTSPPRALRPPGPPPMMGMPQTHPRPPMGPMPPHMTSGGPPALVPPPQFGTYSEALPSPGPSPVRP
jgi:hypothetical protein